MDMLDVLTEPFAASDIKTRKGPGGKTLSYVDTPLVIQRLNAGFDGDWSFRIVSHEVTETEVVVLGGGVVERLGADYMEPVRETAEQYYLNQQDKDQVRIVETELRDYAGVLGAAMLANQSWKRARKK